MEAYSPLSSSRSLSPSSEIHPLVSEEPCTNHSYVVLWCSWCYGITGSAPQLTRGEFRGDGCVIPIALRPSNVLNKLLQQPDVQDGDGYEVKKLTRGPRYCRTCEEYKPPRAHHCKQCKRYVTVYRTIVAYLILKLTFSCVLRMGE